ncbi:MAG TPA: hypothetical protein VFZ68_04165 [Acidimicrobiales bacterium]
MSTWYRVLYFLHIATILVAFAPVLVAVLPDGAAGARATLERVGRQVYAPALILTGLFGILLIIEHEAIDFDELWISLAFLVWFAMNGVFHAMVLAGQRKEEMSRVANGHAVMTVLLVVMLYLMVWKPGA